MKKILFVILLFFMYISLPQASELTFEIDMDKIKIGILEQEEYEKMASACPFVCDCVLCSISCLLLSDSRMAAEAGSGSLRHRRSSSRILQPYTMLHATFTRSSSTKSLLSIRQT